MHKYLAILQRKQKLPVSSSARAFDSTLTAQDGAEKVSRKRAKTAWQRVIASLALFLRLGGFA
jgi:hypothetical protein